MDPLLLGLIAGALTSMAFVPQIARGWRTRRLDDLSPMMLAVMATGLSLWLGYGWLLRDPALILWNVIGILSVVVLLAMRLVWGTGDGSPPA